MKKIKFEQPKAFRPRSSPKTSHVGGKVTAAPRSSPKKSHPGKNLGKFLHPSKMPTGAKIGVGVKLKKPRVNNPKKGY